MDHTTRNETIRALAAASAAEIRSRSDRALRAHALRPAAGEIADVTWAPCPVCRGEIAIPRTTDRPLPLDHEPHRWLGQRVPARDLAPDLEIIRGVR